MLKVEVWSMVCNSCKQSDMVPIQLSDGTLTRWTCNYCGHSISPEDALALTEHEHPTTGCKDCDE